MQIIAVVNRKGGVGKTTTAVNIAAALALAGQRTLLVDLDPQGSVGRALAVEPEQDRGSSAGFTAKRSWRIRYPEPKLLYRLGVVAADDALAGVEVDLLRDPRRQGRLADHLAHEPEHWSFAVLDTPPAVGALNAAALHAADGVLIPVAADFLALDVLRATLATVRAIEKERGRRFAPLAVLATFVDRRRTTEATVALLREQFGDLMLAAAIPRSARFESAALDGVPVVAGARTTAAGSAYRLAADEFLARFGGPPRKRNGAIKSFVHADMRSALRDLRTLPRRG